jgi:sugar lactone lactonase YvrE
MKRTAVVFLALSLSTAASANTLVKSIDLGTHTRPESITRAWGGKYYVSIQGTPDDKKPDGEIVQVDPATGTVTPFVAPGGLLINPRGLAFAGDFLIVTDSSKVWKISKTGEVKPLTETFPFPPVFFNDAAPEKGGKAVFISEMGPGRAVQRDPSGALWPSDSPQAEAIPTGARVYRITLDGKASNAFTPTRKILVTNGIVQGRTPGHLLALDFFHGSVVDVDLKKDSKSVLATGPFRGCDGIEQAKDGTIFVTSFENGRVWRMDATGENVEKLLDLATDLKVPGKASLADLTIDEAAGLLYVPDTAHSQIHVLKMK